VVLRYTITVATQVVYDERYGFNSQSRAYLCGDTNLPRMVDQNDSRFIAFHKCIEIPDNSHLVQTMAVL
jgi:hypothetical protein